MNVRNESKVGSITRLMKESHTSNQPKHGRFTMRVSDANRDQEDTSRNTDEVDPELLRPERMCIFVDQIANKTARWPSKDVKKAEHGRPSAATGLVECGKVLEVVSTENGVDRELATK